ncbi:Uma2 family endonuclease [Sphingomonas gilva]|uniref:Uma2 family endonuclease n=1 Tax=Sphingomonas gilva TaxID=2305907 RepID=A0A396RQ85_9SPHN|nr:Uma2 family endonuclease [Sphingomonas gilva]RHW18744.1 Uma2 family endonuclease [Sphingomonas gilva]
MNLPTPFETPRALKLTVADFELLHRSGAFNGHKRAELIDGEIVSMNAEYRPHSFAKNELTFRLRLALNALGSRFTALSEPTVSLPPHNAPEPDIVVTDAPRGDGYVPLESVALVVEISDTTIRYDRTVKARIYAEAGIAEYWIVDLTSGQLHQHWQPEAERYAETRSMPLAGDLRSVTMPELAIDGTTLR